MDRTKSVIALCLLSAGAALAQGTPATTAPASDTVAQAAAQGITISQGGTIHGTVKAGNLPLPGVAVTATNTLTGKKFAAATDIDGVYALSISKNGRYVVRAELVGFTTTTAEVVLTGDLAAASAKVTDFPMELASRAAAAEARADAATSTASLARGLQGLSLAGTTDADTSGAAVSQGNTGVQMPTLSALNDSVTGDAATSGADSIAVSGQSGQMNGMANFSEDEIRQRISEAVDRARQSGMLPEGSDPTNAIVGMLGGMMGSAGPGGGRRGGGGGGGGRGGRGGGGGGAFRGFNPAQPHGGINYSGEFAPLDSAPWSPTLRPVINPAYVKNSFGATFAGSPYIPGLTKPSTKQFIFLNFSGRRDTTPTILTGTVPTAAQRGDDLSLPGAQFNTAIYNPATGLPFANGVIPRASITPQAAYILNNFYPRCNISADCDSLPLNQYNYQTVTTAGQNSANLSARYVRNIGQSANQPFGGFGRGGGRSSGPPQLRQNLNSNFSYSHSASDSRNLFLILGGASVSDGFNFGLGYTIGYGRFNNTTNLNWNRSHAQTRNYFTDTAFNPSAAAGIARPATLGFRPEFYYGLTNIVLSQFSSITNTAPSETIGQTISFSDSMSWRHKKHNMRWGFDFRRIHQDSLGGSNPLGTVVFTGYNTESPADKAAAATGSATPTTSGSSFADFLLGLPQQSRVQAGLAKIYLRENVLDAYAQDDHRVTDNISLNYGLRYEYFAPFTEKNNRLVNLTGVSTATPAVGCVTPDGVTAGAFACAPGPTSSLLHPDRTMLSPRFGVAWKPKWLKDTVVRTGYGLNFNTGQFATFARLLSYQPPFAAVQNNTLTVSTSNVTGCNPLTPSSSTNLTLAQPFGCSSKPFQNSFAVNPNYRLGMVQIYNFDIQRTLPWGIVANLGYNGSHGVDLDVVRAPNSLLNRVSTANAVAFTYEDSVGESTFNALTLNVRKRLQHGIAMGATYQYAHSIDDASTFGGASSSSSIQNDADLHAERSNSSFDVRHRLTGNWLYELPFGPNRSFLNKGGLMAAIVDGFSLSGDFTFASGTYFTPGFSATPAQIAAGGDYTLRPDRVFAQPNAGAGKVRGFFNTAAFACPSAPLTPASTNCGAPDHYGSASRYSIEGPGQVVVDAALSRTVPLGDTRSIEARMSATNVFNTVQYSGINTTVNAATYGQVTGAAAMRKIVFTARFRF